MVAARFLHFVPTRIGDSGRNDKIGIGRRGTVEYLLEAKI